MKKSITSALLLLLVTSGAEAAPRRPRSAILGVRLGISEEAAHRRLRKIATQQKEEKNGEREGEQEVWLLHDPRLDYLVVRFNHEHRVSSMSVAVRKNSHVRYRELADLNNASQATDGRNYTYTWKVNSGASQTNYVVVARGSDPNYLTSYTVYRPYQ